MFRHATIEDSPFIEKLIAEFYEKQGHVYNARYCPRSTLISVIQTIQNGVVLVGPSSCAGASISPLFTNHNEKVAFVHFWYFKSPREIQIFDALMLSCKLKGATKISAASHFPDHRIMRYYKKLGLQPTEAYSMVEIK